MLQEERYQLLHLNNAQQQGIYTSPMDQLYDVTHGQQIRQLLITQAQPFNPHLDIAGTGSHEIARRSVQYMYDDTQATTEVACVYTPTGHCRFMVPVARMHYLFARFQQTQYHNPKCAERLHATSFPEEAYLLLARCSKEGKLHSNWWIPDNVRTVLHDFCHTTKERFCNPLDSFMHHQECWSNDTRDKLFGFRTDAMQCRWTGISIACPPPAINSLP